MALDIHYGETSMKIYIGADHRGFALKETLKKELTVRGVSFEDLGNPVFDADDDYPDFAMTVAKKVAENPLENRGMLLCGSGHGMDIVANRFSDVRAALCWRKEVALQSREHDDANVLVLPADWLSAEEATDLVFAWLGGPFGGEKRHVRRLKKIEDMTR